jgi:hypothetical protein
VAAPEGVDQHGPAARGPFRSQAGHASLESTRIYLHLAEERLASWYRRAAEAIDAQVLVGISFPWGAAHTTRGATPF